MMVFYNRAEALLSDGSSNDPTEALLIIDGVP